jgi:hypothetical protein
MTFIPDLPENEELPLPFFEDARADFAPHYQSAKTPDKARAEVLAELAKLGAGSVQFHNGLFDGEPPRYGIRIAFIHGGTHGRIDAACLPFKGEATPKKLARARVQALLIVRDWLKAAVTGRVFAPGGDPLVPYLLVDGERTLAQYLVELGDGIGAYLRSPQELPQLPGGDVIEGDFEPA